MRCIRKNLRKTGVADSWDVLTSNTYSQRYILPPLPRSTLPPGSSPPLPLPSPSHVVCHVVLLPSVLVKAVRNVLQFLLLKTTDEAACLQASQRKREEKRGRSNTHTYTLDGASHTCMSSFKASSLFLSLPNESVIRPSWEESEEWEREWGGGSEE